MNPVNELHPSDNLRLVSIIRIIRPPYYGYHVTYHYDDRMISMDYDQSDVAFVNGITELLLNAGWVEKPVIIGGVEYPGAKSYERPV